MNLETIFYDFINSFGVSSNTFITFAKISPLAIIVIAIVIFIYSSGRRAENDAKDRIIKKLSNDPNSGNRGLSSAELARKIAPDYSENGSKKVFIQLAEAILKIAQFNKAETQKKLIQSGDRDRRAISRYILQRGAAMVIAPALTYMCLPTLGFEGVIRIVLSAVAILAGGIVVDIRLDKALKARQLKLSSEFPVLLDLLTIYVESGQSFDISLGRTAAALAVSFPTASEELAFLRQDLELSVDREKTLREFAERLNSGTAVTFVSIVVQSERRGNRIAPALRSLSKEARKNVISTMEKKAQKLPTMMQGPMFLFILPSIFLAVIGPAVIQIMLQFDML